MTSDSLKASDYQIEKLPFHMKGQWQACVQKTSKAELACKIQKIPTNIETTFPDFDGTILYRTQFDISKEISKQALGIYISSLRDSDEVYINGHLIAKTGELEPDFRKATLYSRYYFIPGKILKTSQSNILEIKVFNHVRYGGIVADAPVIDTAENISYRLMKKNGMVMLYIGIFVIISIIQFFYYFAQRKHTEHLYFALLSIGAAAHLYTFSNFIIANNFNLNLVFSVNVFLYAYLTIFFCLFISKFFNQEINTIVKVALVVLAICALIQVTVLPLDYIYYQISFIYFVSVVFILPYYTWLLISAVNNKAPYAKSMAFVILLNILATFVDILTDLQILPQLFSGIAGLIAPMTLIILFLTVSLVLTHRHWIYYRHATFDFLTDALRRSAFLERLHEEISRSQRNKEPLMVALLDIDDFKKINDQHGHIAGDKVLVELVQRTRKELREFDLLGRYGGDEFCFAASVADHQDAMYLLKRIKSSVTQEPIQVTDETDINLSITIGAYVADPNSDFHPKQLIAQADNILVKGKVNQKGKIHI